MSSKWHSCTTEEVLNRVDGSRFGLTDIEAKRRLKTVGKNTLPQGKKLSRVRLFLNQFRSPLVYILLIAVLISFFLRHYSDAVFILLVLFTNTVVGFYQENKANNSLDALKKMVKIRSRVFRNGSLREIDSQELVPGDVISLRPGDKVPADSYLLEVHDAKVNEASLTGEWIAEEKALGVLPEKTVLGDRLNMVHMGTIFESGRATAVVVETGIRTEIGKVVSLIEAAEERLTPLQKKIAKLSQWVGVFILVLTVIVVVIGILNDRSFEEIFVTSLALAVAAIPAGLLPAITIILALGMRRILKKNGLVRKLIANETLGSITVICTDKTGTLTEGRMEVASILTSKQELIHDKKNPVLSQNSTGLESHITALIIATLCNEAFVENPEDELHNWIVRGTPTEQALLLAGTHAGLNRYSLEKEFPVLDRASFSSEYKFAATLHQFGPRKKILYAVGAPDVLLAKSISIDVDGTTKKLSKEQVRALSERLSDLTSKGLRVVMCTKRSITTRNTYEKVHELVDKMTVVGFIALKDPLRTDVRRSIALTKRAGIQTIIITGDHRGTAQAIAREIGILADDEHVIEGIDIDELSPAELKEKIKTITICARVSPRHKVRLVDALQSNNEVVAMLGDGVNDAPALKTADVGVSVGSGTDVAKEVADLVLLDDSFSTIVHAIEQGRVIFQNIRKVFMYLVADAFSQLFLFIGALLLGLPLPLLAAQILWISLVEDGFPDIALTTEQETAGVMDEPPRRPDEPILNKPLTVWMTFIFFISGISAFATFYTSWIVTGDIEFTQTIVFGLVALDSLLFAFNVRSFRQSVFRKDIFSNRLLVWAVCVSVLLLFCAIYLPPLQAVLSTVPLEPIHWMVILGVSALETILIELSRRFAFRKNTLSSLLKKAS